jgi:hypothetical protein
VWSMKEFCHCLHKNLKIFNFLISNKINISITQLELGLILILLEKSFTKFFILWFFWVHFRSSCIIKKEKITEAMIKRYSESNWIIKWLHSLRRRFSSKVVLHYRKLTFITYFWAEIRTNTSNCTLLFYDNLL